MRYNGLNCWFNGQEGLPGLYAYCLSALYKSLKKPTIFSPKLSWSTRSGQLFTYSPYDANWGTFSTQDPQTLCFERLFFQCHIFLSLLAYLTYVFPANHTVYLHDHLICTKPTCFQPIIQGICMFIYYLKKGQSLLTVKPMIQ